MLTPGHILQNHWSFACCPPQGYPERILSYPAKSHPSKALALSCQDEIFLRSSLQPVPLQPFREAMLRG